ncbi:uncharacterized protein BKCO1_1800050 [Diplodia corticola]|uniref:GmrSD restriction endonucleases N-terminal domain-containing protein n=1 Tax=Diplodia corticola TaxID=236234 RepID=A0A1J9RRX0_9PEZI|nr:uncharacterized protein BKCO1_1800050 [Diplodia corticola]OJD35291.1 hypothetical protein BKCO1_1800050 [Diplodia corticola]
MPPSPATAQHAELDEALLDADRGDRASDAEVAPQRGRYTTSASGHDSRDMSTSSQPVRIKGESDTEGDDDDERDNLRVFEARPSLPAPRVEHRSLQDLMGKRPVHTRINNAYINTTDLLSKDSVDINPEYQRDVVWNKERMMGLIDSVIENHYIPPIIFNRQISRNQDGKARIKRVCIDGKQRLSSVKAFMDGTIGCHDRRGSVWYYTPSSNKRSARTIPEQTREAFRNRKLIIYEYPNLGRLQEEDLFSRVQKGVQLTTAEKFRATTGPWQEFAESYKRDFPRVGGLAGQKRGVDFNNILSSFGQILEVQRSLANGNPPTFSTQISTIKSLLKNVKDYNAETKDKLRRTYMKLDKLVEIDLRAFMDNQYSHAKLFSPLEFMATAVLISLHLEDESNQFLLESIRIMRLYLRQCLKDLRMNKSAWNCVWPFLESLRPPPERETPPVTPPDTLLAVRATIAQRLAHLSPAIDPAHIPISGDVDSEPPPTILTDIPTATPNCSVQLSNDRRFILCRLEDNPGLPNHNSLGQEKTSSVSSSPADMQTPQLDTSQPENVEAKLREHISVPIVDQTSQMPKPESTGISRKRKLARFTASGSSPQGREIAQPPKVGDASTRQKPHPHMAPGILTAQKAVDETTTPSSRKLSANSTVVAQTQQLRTNGSELVVEISDEETGEAAENLLAKFKPHTSKRVKVKEEDLDV